MTTCPGCGIELPERAGAASHAYIGASPECWALYGELLAREYEDAARFGVHQLTVDTYAVQHPGAPERRSIQSVGLHLMTLCLFVEEGADPAQGPKLHKRFVKRPPDFRWLDPPRPIGAITVADPLATPTAEAHREAVNAWARDVWDAWSPHHDTVRRWIAESA